MDVFIITLFCIACFVSGMLVSYLICYSKLSNRASKIRSLFGTCTKHVIRIMELKDELSDANKIADYYEKKAIEYQSELERFYADTVNLSGDSQ